MKIIKKYTAIQLGTKNVDDNVVVELSYGNIEGQYYSLEYPKEEFNSEEEATEYAHKTNEYGRWLILPIIRFNNFED